MEQTASANGTSGYLLQVVGGNKVIAAEHLRLQGAAIAVDLHLIQTAETGTAHQLLSKLIDTCLWYADLRPTARGENRVGDIQPSLSPSRTGEGGDGGGLQAQFKTHQLLILAITEHQGNKGYAESALAAAHTDILLHLGQDRQRLTADGFIPPDFILAHVNKLGIVDADSIDRVGKVLA